jgi:hypothetical protein
MDNQRLNPRTSEQAGQDSSEMNRASQHVQSDGTHIESGFTTNIGFQNPGAPAEHMGFDPLPSSGDVGALDPGAGGDISDEDMLRQLGGTNTVRSAPEDAIRQNEQSTSNERGDSSTSGGSSTSW